MYALGDASNCGVNPCTWWDNIYASDACLAYNQCANPTAPSTVLESQGLIAGGSQILGQTAQSSVTGFIQGLTQDPITGQTNWTNVFVLVGGVVLLLMLLEKR